MEDFIYYPHNKSFYLLSNNDSISSPVYMLKFSFAEMPANPFWIIPYPENSPSVIQNPTEFVDPSKSVWYDKLAIFIFREW